MVKPESQNLILSGDAMAAFVANIRTAKHAPARARKLISLNPGPGGHSYGAFGMANPIQAMGRAIAKIDALEVPRQPKTTFNVGRVGGGTSVNAIPFEAWMEVDMRSADPAALHDLDTRFN